MQSQCKSLGRVLMTDSVNKVSNYRKDALDTPTCERIQVTLANVPTDANSLEGITVPKVVHCTSPPVPRRRNPPPLPCRSLKKTRSRVKLSPEISIPVTPRKDKVITSQTILPGLSIEYDTESVNVAAVNGFSIRMLVCEWPEIMNTNKSLISSVKSFFEKVDVNNHSVCVFLLQSCHNVMEFTERIQKALIRLDGKLDWFPCQSTSYDMEGSDTAAIVFMPSKAAKLILLGVEIKSCGPSNPAWPGSLYSRKTSDSTKELSNMKYCDGYTTNPNPNPNNIVKPIAAAITLRLGIAPPPFMGGSDWVSGGSGIDCNVHTLNSPGNNSVDQCRRPSTFQNDSLYVFILNFNTVFHRKFCT